MRNVLEKVYNFYRELLSENSELSMVRFLSFICVIVAAALAFYGIHESKHSLESLAVLCGTFLGAGLGAKVMQRKFESHSETSSENESEPEVVTASNSEKES